MVRLIQNNLTPGLRKALISLCSEDIKWRRSDYENLGITRFKSSRMSSRVFMLHPTESVLQTSADTVDFVRCNSRLYRLHLLQLLRGTVVAIQNAAQTSGVHFQHVAPLPELRTQNATFKLGSRSESCDRARQVSEFKTGTPN